MEDTTKEVRELRENLSSIKKEIGDLAKNTRVKVVEGTSDWMKENPWATIGIAAGVAASVGFLLGFMVRGGTRS